MRNSYRRKTVFLARIAVVVYKGELVKGFSRVPEAMPGVFRYRCRWQRHGARPVLLPVNMDVLLMGGTIPPLCVCMVCRQNYNRPIDRPVPAAAVLMRAQAWVDDIGSLVCHKLPCSNDLTCYCAA